MNKKTRKKSVHSGIKRFLASAMTFVLGLSILPVQASTYKQYIVSDFDCNWHYYGRTNPEFLNDSFDMTKLDGWTNAPTPVGFVGSGLAPATVLTTGAGAYQRGNPYHTWTYFKKAFTLDASFDPKEITNVSGTHRIDDALVLYINGIEVYRFNTSMAASAISVGQGVNWSAPAAGAAIGTPVDRSFEINRDYSAGAVISTIYDAASRTNLEQALKPGENVITCVVGNQSTGSSDLWFNLDMSIECGGELPPPLPGDSPSTPHSIVTTFKGDPKTCRAFTWHTDGSGTTGTIVQYMEGDTFEKTNALSTAGTSAPLNVLEDYNGGDASKTSVTMHKAEITGLKPGTAYTYRVGSSVASEDGWSEPRTFTTEGASPDTPFTFVHITDSQDSAATHEWFERTINAAAAQFPNLSFFLHTGDIVEQGASEREYQNFFRKGQGVIDEIPLMAVPGNHDYYLTNPAVAGHGGNGANFISHFNFPDNGAALSTIGNSTYSFDYGAVHFIGIDANYMSTPNKGAEVAAWLKRDLGGTDKQWKVVYMHQGPYLGRSVFKNDVAVAYAKTYLVPVFDQYGVDLALQGHDHHYMRSFFVKGILPNTPGSYPDKLLGSASDTPHRDNEGTIYTIANSTGAKFYDDLAQENITSLPWLEKFQQPRLGMFVAYTVSGDTITATAYTVDSRGETQVYDTYKLWHSITPPAEVTDIFAEFDGKSLNIGWEDSETEGASVLIYDSENLRTPPLIVSHGINYTSIPMSTDRSEFYIIKTVLGRNISKGRAVKSDDIDTPLVAPVARKAERGSVITVTGSLGINYSGKNVSLLITTEGAEPASLDKQDIVYMDQCTAERSGRYAFRFKWNPQYGAIDGYHIYMNVGGAFVDDPGIETVTAFTELFSGDLQVSIDGGEASADVTVNNYYGVEGYPYTVLLAAYTKNNVLSGLKTVSGTIPAMGMKNELFSYDPLPSSTEYLKVFVFKDLTGLVPYMQSTPVSAYKESKPTN